MFGALLATGLIALHPPTTLLLLAVIVSQGFAQAYAVRNYMVTAVAASVLGLVLAHLLHTGTSRVFALIERVGHTVLGAGGLARAYTDSVAKALLQAEKVALRRMQALRCSVPYALEGLLRREIAAAGAELLEVAHGSQVELQLRLPQTETEAFMARVGELAHGRVAWLAQD